jgi:LacI family transcriptional regulator
MIAKRLKYRPSELARGLIMQRTGSIGVIVPNVINLFFAEVLQRIENVARGRGYHVVLSISEENPEEEATCLDTLIKRRVDGIIIAPTEMGVDNKEYFLELEEKKVPLVFIDRYMDQIEKNYVLVDCVSGAYQAVNHLLGLGHRRIGYICGPRKISVSEDRFKGYKKALKEAGIEYSKNMVIEVEGFGKEHGYDGMRYFLNMKEDERPTGVFAGTDMFAVGALKAIRESGLKVPSDISIVGFDNIELSSFLEVPLTTIDQQKDKIGEIAGNMLLDLIEHKEEDIPHQIVIEPRLIVRESCRQL